jgi:hypothetical protein
MYVANTLSHTLILPQIMMANLKEKKGEEKHMAYGYKEKRKRMIFIILVLLFAVIFLVIKFTTREVVDKINRVEDFNVLSDFLDENYLFKEHQVALMSYVNVFKQWPTRLLMKDELLFSNYKHMQGEGLENPQMESLLSKESVKDIYELETANYHEIERYLKNEKNCLFRRLCQIKGS